MSTGWRPGWPPPPTTFSPSARRCSGTRRPKSGSTATPRASLQVLPGDGTLTQIEEELFRFMQILDGSEQLRTTLSGRDVSAEARRRLVEDLLSSKATPTTQRLGGLPDPGRASPRLRGPAWPSWWTGVAGEPPADGRGALGRLSWTTTSGRTWRARCAAWPATTVELRVTVDPSVLGGVRRHDRRHRGGRQRPAPARRC